MESENRHPGFLSHDRSWCLVPSARLIPEKKTKWRERSVVRCRCVVVHAACIVDDPSDWCVPNYPKARCRIVSVSASTHFGFNPLVLIAFSILPVASSFEFFALELYFPCLSFLYSRIPFFRDLSTKELLVELGFNFKDEIIYQLKKISLIFDLKSEQECIINFL